MTNRRTYFSRVSERVDLPALDAAFVVVVGGGSVGSAICFELARCGVGHIAIADGDRLELHNPVRHALPTAYVGTNKAEALAAHLVHNVPDIDVGALPRHMDEAYTDLEIDQMLHPADLVIIATDDRETQRRIARRALAMDLPAVVPGLYAEGGGEVFVQLGPGQACFNCWDGFRAADASVRGARSVNADGLAVIQEAIFLSLALLEPSSPHARELAPTANDPRPRQLFIQRPGAPLLRAPAARRPTCPSCAVGPSPINDAQRPAADASAHFRGAGIDDRARAAGWGFSLRGVDRPPTIETVTVSSSLVIEGGTVLLEWAAVDATHVIVETVGRRPPVGRAEVVVRHSRAFRVEAVNPFGWTEAVTPVVRTMPAPRLPAAVPAPLPHSPTASVEIALPGAPSGVGAPALPRIGAVPAPLPVLPAPPTMPAWPHAPLGSDLLQRGFAPRPRRRR
ncbi:MAG TPA: ThiF family adenylyltransferase [Baekduia sp.]|nr:ThiF family adenylyltransferase [Baekduia sp.]